MAVISLANSEALDYGLSNRHRRLLLVGRPAGLLDDVNSNDGAISSGYVRGKCRRGRSRIVAVGNRDHDPLEE